MMFGSPEETAAFLKRCRRRHRALRKDARTQGERLFAERARPFAERIEAYWLIAAGDAAKAVAEATARQCRGLRRCAHRTHRLESSRAAAQTRTFIPS